MTNQTSVPSTEVSKKSDPGMVLPSVDLSDPNNVPDPAAYEAMEYEMMANYWSPTQAGDKKLLIFNEIRDEEMPDQNTGEMKTLKTACFYEPRKDESGKQLVEILNSSTILVAKVAEYVASGKIVRGTTLFVTYLGREQNKTNSKSSAQWSVKPAIPKVLKQATSSDAVETEEAQVVV